MRLVFFLSIFLSACASQVRLQVSCILEAAGPGVLIANCADAETWKEERQKQVEGKTE